MQNSSSNIFIDFHAHLDNSQERLDELFEAQDRSGVGKTIVVSGNLLNPLFLGDFLRGSTSIMSYEPNNSHLLAVSKKNPSRIIPFFTIDPNFHAAEDIEEALEVGFKGFKFNPLVHKVDLNDGMLSEIYDVLNSSSAPLYTHITLNPASSIEALSRVSQAYQSINFVVGHMGYATSDQLALNLASQRNNIYLETSVGSALAFKYAKEKGLYKKLIYGSEFPAHDPYIELEKLKLIFPDNNLIDVARENALAILGI